MYYIIYPNELRHHGIKGQKWGVRRFQNEDGSYTEAGKKRYLKVSPSDSSVTKRVKKDYNELSEAEFRKKYSSSKKTYAKRVEKYGDPYMNAPLAKMGKKLKEKQNVKKKAQGVAGGTVLSEKQRKTIKIGAVVTASALVAVGGYALYKSGKLDGAISKGKELVSEQMSKLKNVGYNATDLLKRKAVSNSTKIGMIGRQFVSEQTAKAKEAIINGIGDGSKELSKAGMTAVVGIAAKKISDAIIKNDQEAPENAVKNILLTSANKAVDSFNNSINASVTNNSSGSSKGGSIGKDISKKLGPAPQEKFSPSDETRYQAIFKSSKVNGNVEARQTVKTLRKQGYSIDQIERYVSWL